ncbi:hypothetical protein [Arthrobacter tecti]
MDRLLNKKPLPPERATREVTESDVRSRVDLLVTEAKQRGALRVLEFANGLALYPGESISRVNMHLLGFPAPELQHSFSDARGKLAEVDFWWKDYGLVGEFDGRTKYLKPEYLKGRTPSQVVIDEKNRENRLRALGLNVVRWEWPTAITPERLAEHLRNAGLPAEGRRRTAA